MTTTTATKLRKLTEDIAAKGNTPLTRLTVLKKWFETPDRLPAFGVWMARRAIAGERSVDIESRAFCR